MAKSNKKSSPKSEPAAYRHAGEKRTNIPPARIAGEGKIPKVKKAKYYYSPHLSPELRFDPTGEADRILAVKEKAAQYLTAEERDLLDKALSAQQPWLEWAGKKEQHDRGYFEVDPVALHIHERVSAQAIVRTAMRQDVQRDLFADPQLEYKEAVKFYKHDVDWANRLILGDSLQVMSSLAKRENLAGKVQMIYMDPPYGIRFSSNFQAQIYKLDVKDNANDLVREIETVKAYKDTWLLGMHSYLLYLFNRLVISRELLSDSGSLFFQIGDQNVHFVRTIIEEVFGSENLIATIVFKKSGSRSGDYLDSTNDYLLWFGKNKKSMKYIKVFQERESEESSGKYPLVELTSGNIVPAERENHEGLVFIDDQLLSSGATDAGTFIFDHQAKSFHPGSSYHWKTNFSGLTRLAESDRLIIRGSWLKYKRYHKDYPVIPYTNLWLDTVVSTFSTIDKKLYSVQTATKVIERCMLMSTSPGDIILDPTCGSGTSAYIAEKWGRRWIAIDTSRVALSIARQRLLTAKYDYYKLASEADGIRGNFSYLTVPHITLKSIARNKHLDPIVEKHRHVLDDALARCNEVVQYVSREVRHILKLKLKKVERQSKRSSIADADRRRWLLPEKGQKWEHWQVPFDTDPDWPQELQDAVTAYRKAWRAKMDEVNACIAENAEPVELVDQPEVVKGVLRVSGPFTVEGVRPEELSLGGEGLFDPTQNEWEEDDAVAGSVDEGQNLRAYLTRMVSLLKQDGVTFPGNKHRKFENIESLFEQTSASVLHAEAAWAGAGNNGERTVAIAFGPQYGPVTATQVEDLIRASRRYDELVIAAFSFDSAATAAIQENEHPRLKVHMAHIRPDVSPGMDGLLKDTPNSQLFTVFGQPEIRVRKTGKEGKRGKGEEAEDEYEVELAGVDIYDPLTGEVRSTGAEKVAAWFLDSDYDGRCFCITQAFFPDQDAWGKIAKALGSSADEEAFEAFKGTVSLPFKVGKHRRIAVKVIDPRGNEVVALQKL